MSSDIFLKCQFEVAHISLTEVFRCSRAEGKVIPDAKEGFVPLRERSRVALAIINKLGTKLSYLKFFCQGSERLLLRGICGR